MVGVSIFDSSSGGLFIPPEASVRPGNFIALPNQPVNTKGYYSAWQIKPQYGRGVLRRPLCESILGGLSFNHRLLASNTEFCYCGFWTFGG
jgi:hypothetical protein